jgi:Fungal trichothecene efflux pump (TRI12)
MLGFYINLPIGGAVTALLAFIHVPDRTTKGRTTSTLQIVLQKLDLPGFALFAPAAVQFLLALNWGGHLYPWDSATVIGLFCGAAGTLCVFLAWEYREGDVAMVPLSMVRRRIVWSSCLVMAFFMGCSIILSYYLPIYFQTVMDATPTLSGVYLLPGILSQILFAVMSGILGILDPYCIFQYLTSYYMSQPLTQ